MTDPLDPLDARVRSTRRPRQWAQLLIAASLLVAVALIYHGQREATCRGDYRGDWERALGELVVSFVPDDESGEQSNAEVQANNDALVQGVEQANDDLGDLDSLCGGWWP